MAMRIAFYHRNRLGIANSSLFPVCTASVDTLFCIPGMICIRVFALLLFLLSGGLRCEAYQSSDRDKEAVLLLQWAVQAQSAGYLVAQDKGYYRERGISLTVLSGGGSRSSPRFLEEGKATFSVMPLSTALKYSSEGKPFVNIGQILQRSGLMFIARKSSGIRKPADMMDRAVGLWDGNSRIEAELFLKMNKLKVRVIPQSFTVNLFLFNGLDLASATVYNEYHTIINSGFNKDELVTFMFSDYGLDFPQDGIYVLDNTYRRDSELCGAFTNASIRGWEYSFEHPDEAVDIVMKHMEKEHLPASRVHQKWMLERIKALSVEEGICQLTGELSGERYRRLAGLMKEYGMIRAVPPFPSFFKGIMKDR